MEITGMDDKENEEMVKVTSRLINGDDDDGSKAGGILGDLTKNQLETLISPSYKASCEPCFSPSRGASRERRILSEWDQSFSRQNDSNEDVPEQEPIGEPEEKRPKSSKPEDPPKTATDNLFEDLSRDAFGALKSDMTSRPKSRCATVPEEPLEEIMEEAVPICPLECKERCDRKVSAPKIEISKPLVLRKKDSMPCSFRLYRGLPPLEKSSIKSFRSIARSSSSTTGYEITVRPSGTFNINAGPVRIFKYGLDLRNLKGKLTEEIVNRISTPTESSKIRSLKEECLPNSRRTLGGTVTRDFICECCKRRHS